MDQTYSLFGPNIQLRTEKYIFTKVNFVDQSIPLATQISWPLGCSLATPCVNNFSTVMQMTFDT